MTFNVPLAISLCILYHNYRNMCHPTAQQGKRTLQDVVHYYSVGLLLISIFLFGMDLTTTVIWLYSFGQGMFVGILGIATASMGISYSKIKDEAVFKFALKKVMVMVFYNIVYFFLSKKSKAWVTISFSFCIFFWIVVAMGMFIDNYYCGGYYYYCYTYYPYAFVGELLCFMIQWGFLFYFINMLGSPCTVVPLFSVPLFLVLCRRLLLLHRALC